MSLGQFIVNNVKNDLEHFLNSRNRRNFENQKSAEVAGNNVKNGRFRP